MPSPNKNRDISSRSLVFFSILAGLAALSAVTATINDPGITLDEPHYYESCLQEIAWFRQAVNDISNGEWGVPFTQEVLDRHWNFELIYNVHPPFYKLSSSLTLVLFERWLGTMGAYRLSPAIMFSILVGLLFFTVGRRYGLLSGFWAAAGFALMPRIFGHAHFGATDMPLTFLWFASAVCFHRALESRRWALVFALVYGLALSTKFTAFVIPLPLAAYIVLSRRFKESLWPVGLGLLLSPLLMIGLNPQWWNDTFQRIYLYILNSATRSEYLQIPTYYLGEQYNFFLPWHHSLVYTFFTVSPVVLAGFIYGFWRTVRRPMADQWASHMLLHWLAIHLVMILPSSPGHDGVRLFLPSFAFLAVISAKGFHDFIILDLPSLFARIPQCGLWTARLVRPLIVAIMVIPSAVALVRFHPYELCYYNCLAGGIPGAKKLGMETTYWFDALNDTACKLLNDTLPDSATVFTIFHWHCTFLQRLGKIKPTLTFSRENFTYKLQYYRQGIFHDQDWILCREGTPLAELKKDGVPLLAIYNLPQAGKEIINKLVKSKNDDSYYEMMLIYQLLGQPDSAFLSLNKYLELKPKDFKANMSLVSLYLENNLPDKALEHLQRVADNPENPKMWYYYTGWAYHLLGKNEEAFNYLQKCFQYQKLEFSTRNAMAIVCFQLGKLEESARQYELALRSQPYDEGVLHMLGKINQSLKRNETARYYYTQVLELNPNHLPTLVNVGVLERSEGKVKEAKVFYLRALKVDSTNVSANFNLANIFLETGDTVKAENLYKNILKYQPADTLTVMTLTRLYLKDPKRHMEALEYFRILARIIPEQAESLEKNFIKPLENEILPSVLAYSYFLQGKLEKAIEQYEIVLRTRPDDEGALHMMGRIEQSMKRNARARFYYNKLLKVNPRHLPTLVNMGVLERSEGRVSQSETYYRKALEADSLDATANFNLANLYTETGKQDKAEKLYRIILMGHPGDSQAHLALGRLLAKDPRRLSEALKHLRTAASLEPEKARVIEENFIRPLETKLGHTDRQP